MKSALGMCFNWKVLVGLGVAAVGILLIAPSAALAVLPLLLLAACPLSMVVMMFAMRGHSGGGESCRHTEGDASIEAKRARLAALRDEGQRAELELSASTVANTEEPLASTASPSASRIAS
ncbi:MAG: DUF2933 domain-containing protein [Dehalococcoidia bacterium]|nr:DUF2933 domain-containing protein [Dehalococcoidia bacterium]